LTHRHLHSFPTRRSSDLSNLSSAPMGIMIGYAYAPSFLRMSLSAFSKFAPVRSILLTNAMRGTLYFVACRQTVSDCGCTPATPQDRKSTRLNSSHDQISY